MEPRESRAVQAVSGGSELLARELLIPGAAEHLAAQGAARLRFFIAAPHPPRYTAHAEDGLHQAGDGDHGHDQQRLDAASVTSGARGWYTADEVARRSGASPDEATQDADEAYAHVPETEPTRYRDGGLPSARARDGRLRFA
jgi:hypothetical protein